MSTERIYIRSEYRSCRYNRHASIPSDIRRRVSGGL